MTSHTAAPGDARAPVFVTLASAARRAGISTPTALTMAAAREFPAVIQLGKRKMISRAAFESWLREKLEAAAA